MAISSAERGELFKLAVGFFDASPGTAYLAELTSTYEALRGAGLSQSQAIQSIATSLDNTGAFMSVYPNYQTNSEFANAWLGTLGLGGNAIATDFVVSQLNAGADKGGVVLAGLNALLAYSGDDVGLNAAKALLQNKIAAAEYYTLTLGGSSTDVGVLQASLDLVTSDPASVAAQNAQNDDVLNPPPPPPASSATLTTDNDTVVLLPEGSTINAPRAYYPGGQVLVNTLQTEDDLIVQGGGGMLNAQLVQLGPVEGPATYIGPNTIEGVKTVNVDLLGGSVELDLQDDHNADITDVNLNKVRQGMDGYGSMYFTNLQDNVENLKVHDTGSNGMDSVRFLFENNFAEMNDGDKDLNLDLKDVDMWGSLVIMDDDGTAFDQLHIKADDAWVGETFVAYASDITTEMSGDFGVWHYEDGGNVDTMVFTGHGDLYWGQTGWNQTLFDASALVDERPGDTSDVYVGAHRMLETEPDGPDAGSSAVDDNEVATILTAGGDDFVDAMGEYDYWDWSGYYGGFGGGVQRVYDGATIKTFAGDDIVAIGDFMFYGSGNYGGSGWANFAGYGGDVGDNVLIDTGTGSDTVLVGGSLLTDPLEGGDDDTPDTLITTGDGADFVFVGYDVETGVTVDTGADDDVAMFGMYGWVETDNWAAFGGSDRDSFFAWIDGIRTGDVSIDPTDLNTNHGTMDGTVDLGEGDDQAYISYVGYDGVVHGGAGDDRIYVYNDIDGQVYGDDGDDIIKVDGGIYGWDGDDNLGLVDAGAGDDIVWVADDVDGTLLAGDGDDEVVIGLDIWGDHWVGRIRDGDVDLGDGDDTITFYVSEEGDGDGTEIIYESGTLAGGDGDDTMIVYVSDADDFWIDGAGDFDGDGKTGANRITGIEHLEVYYSGGAIEDGFVDLSAFDSALVDVTLNNDDGDDYNEGDYYNVDGERFIISSEDHSGDEDADFWLNVTGEDVSGTDDTLFVTLAATGVPSGAWWNFDVSIDDQTFGRDGTFYENLDLTIADEYSHVIWLNNDFGGQTNDSPSAPASGNTATADGRITVTGGAAGQWIDLMDVSAGTVVADIAANVHIDLDEDQNHDLTTGSGDDVIDAAFADDITEFDAIDMGAGRDRLIIADTNPDLGNIGTGSDEDFANKHGIEEIQVLGDTGVIELMLDDDAYDTGIDTLILTEYGGDSADAIVRLGDDFERDFTVVMEEDSTIELNNESSRGLLAYDLTFNLFQLDDSENNYQRIDLLGLDQNNVTVNLEIGQTDSIDIADVVAGPGGGDDFVEINIGDRTGNNLDKLVITEATPPSGTGVTYHDNGEIQIELSTEWQKAGGVLTIDAGAIGDDDWGWNGSAWAAMPDSSTGGMSIFNGYDVDYALKVTGTANDDYVEGTAQADWISGGAGDDEIYGGDGNDTIDGGAGDDYVEAGDGNDTVTLGDGNDTVYGEAGNDTIDGGAGNDLIVGGAGNDVLTGGTGRDTFVFEGDAASNGRDTITDFTGGNLGDVFDFAALTLGGGIAGGGAVDPAWENAVNETTGKITMIQAIDLAGAGKATLQDEIMVVKSAAINAEANALVAGWLTGTSTTGVVITGSQGSSEIYVWYVDNSIDGQAGQVTAEDVALVGVVTMASGTIDSLSAITATNPNGNIDIWV